MGGIVVARAKPYIGRAVADSGAVASARQKEMSRGEKIRAILNGHVFITVTNPRGRAKLRKLYMGLNRAARASQNL